MVDVLSRGRVECGFVRSVPYEIAAGNSNPVRLRERMYEALDLIVRARTTQDGPFSFEGQYYHHRMVNIWPRPYQQPHPPIWIPSMGSSETIKRAAAPERKYPFLVTFSPESAVVRYHNMYREAAQAHGYTASGGQLG